MPSVSDIFILDRVLLLQNIIANVCHEFNNNHVIFKTVQFIGFVRL